MPDTAYQQRILKGMYIDNPTVQYIVYIPLIIAAMVYGMVSCGITWWECALAFLASAGFWTVFEYTMHRYFFHANPKRQWLRKFLYSIHWGHHEYPNDGRIMLVNPLVSVPTAGLLYLIFYLVAGAYVHPFMAGVMSIYLLYDWFHFAAHNKNYNHWWFQLMKRHHLKHHYQDSTKNYGFTSTIWDKALDTELESSKVVMEKKSFR